MGCLVRLGCLAMLAILAVCAWLTRDRWLPRRYHSPAGVAATNTGWQPITNAGADRAKVALEKLSQPTGQAFQTISASDLASFAFKALSPAVANSADSISTRVSGESVSMRAVIRTAELRNSGALGPMAGMLGEREPVELTGTFAVVRPGLAEFNVQELTVRDFPIPRAMIPSLINQVSRDRPPGLSASSLPLPIPRYVGDIRVANGKVILYKSMQ